MPFIQVKTNIKIEKTAEIDLKTLLGRDIELLPGKSETWLMVEIEDSRKLYFQGSDAPCAIVEVKVYGGSDKKSYQKFTEKVTHDLHALLGLSPERIYVEYEETPHWGYAGDNF